MATSDTPPANNIDPAQRQTQKVQLDTNKVTTAYSNFFTLQESAEEVVLNFGLAQQWAPNQKGLQVQMLQQVIVSPNSARRLRDSLTQLIERREERMKKARGGS